MAGLQRDTDAIAAIADVKKMDTSIPSEKLSGEFHDHDLDHEDDGVHDGLEFPTDEEIATLRRVSDAIPWNAYLIAIVELAERFSFYGSTVVFTNFIQQPLPAGSHTGAGGPDGVSGALGLLQRAATGLTTFYQFWCYITPLYGAYLADAHWGRFKTIAIAVFVALLGHIIFIISAIPGVIEKKGAVGVFVLGMIVTGLGTGLFKANISPLVAEQYKRTKLFVTTTKSGERVIVDPAMTVSRIYMYFYLFINIGALVGQITMTYAEKYVGFWLAYTLPTGIFLLCPIVLFIGRNRYNRTPPTGSVLATTLRLFRYAARGKWSLNPVRTYKNLSAPDFWENAKPSRVHEPPVWMTFDDLWVDEVKRGLKACGVFLWFPIYWLTYNQLNNNLTSQAATMNTHGLPNDVLSNLDPFALIILIPICDRFIYPGLVRMGYNFTALKKITLGFFTGAAAMAWAAAVQHYIYKTNPCGHSASTCKEISPLNVWIQTGSYILIAISEILASITGLEYAFTKAPKNMRSLVMAVFLFMSALSSALGEAFVSLSADPLLVWNYGSMGVLAAVTGILFWFSVRNLDRHEDELNNMQSGHLTTEKEH
ncbi:POT family-domain-containing protein [Crepidotus variabilis]|uniref:POT family-domain-containing protein n=1 Tax=Crepidotus variabilis TaxID=179855 RepID=A0A9P6EKL2_9AGAR|nr:POT family-domain-containing protein [Crepidotus variabilis]